MIDIIRQMRSLFGLPVSCAVLVAVALTVIGGVGPAAAQSTQLPGLVVTVPPSSDSEAAPEPKPKAKPKPRRRAPATRKRTRSRSTSRASRGGRGRGRASGKLVIALLVNDDPITNFEIRERAKLMAATSNLGPRAQAVFKTIASNPRTNERLKAILRKTVEANPGKSRDQIIALFERKKKAFGRRLQERALARARASAVSGFTSKAREELVNERLKLQEAERLGIKIGDDQVNQFFARVAKRNKMSAAQFAQHLKKIGASARTMKEKFRADIAWGKVVGRQFGRLVSVGEREIDQFIGAQTDTSDVRLRVHRITLPVPDSLDQSTVAARLNQADQLRRRFNSCRQTQTLASGIRGAKFADLRDFDPEAVGEPSRSLLLSADVNEMIPPNLGQAGIELYAVCDRNTSGSSFEARTAASRKLQRREMEMLGRRHLADLKRDAHIEKR